MPKKPNITNEQIEAVAQKASDLTFEIMDLAEEARAGRCDVVAKPEEMARAFASLARAAADAAVVVLVRKAADELDADLQRLRKAAST
jgi:hypothetical protein